MTEIDPFERLRKLETQTYNKRYFYYNPIDGSVISIHTNVIDEPYPFVEVSIEDLPEDFVSLNLTDFIVIDENNKKKISTKKIALTRIDGSIPVVYVSSIEEIESDEVNLFIEQDNSKKEFRLFLSDKSKEYYWRDTTALNFIFFVTLENDPTILYTTFSVSFLDLLEKEHIVIPFGKYDGSKSNIYTVKFFHSYLHVVYDENKNP